MYLATNGNTGYSKKPIGQNTYMDDKVVLGYCCTCICLTMLIGPLFFFSDGGGLQSLNLISSGNFQVFIDIS
jgi:hypothetical protein